MSPKVRVLEMWPPGGSVEVVGPTRGEAYRGVVRSL